MNESDFKEAAAIAKAIQDDVDAILNTPKYVYKEPDITIDEFIETYGIVFDINHIGEHSEEYPKHILYGGGKGTYQVDDYKVKIKFERRSATFDYHQGEGNRGRNDSDEQIARSLLDSIASECRDVECYKNWEDYASDFERLDDISWRDAEQYQKTWKAMQSDAKKLRRVLGEEVLKILLDEVIPL